jgi:type II secretory pathway component PulF
MMIPVLTALGERTIVRPVNGSTAHGRVWTLAPLLVFYAAQVVLWVLLLFVLPTLARPLADTGTALPGLTRWALEASELVRRSLLLVAAASVLSYVVLGLLVHYRGREMWVRVLLGILAALSLLHLVVVFLSTRLPDVKVP